MLHEKIYCKHISTPVVDGIVLQLGHQSFAGGLSQTCDRQVTIKWVNCLLPGQTTMQTQPFTPQAHHELRDGDHYATDWGCVWLHSRKVQSLCAGMGCGPS